MNLLRWLLPGLLIVVGSGCGPGNEVTLLRTPAEGVPLPPPVLDGWSRGVWIDFGPRDLRAPGALALSAVIRYREAGWSRGMVQNGMRRGGARPFLDSWIEGQGADFTLGLQPSLEVCRVRLVLGDRDAARGPVDVDLNGTRILTGVRTGAAEYLTVDAVVPRPGGRLVVTIDARDCGTFSIPGLALYLPSPNGEGGTSTAVLATRFPAPVRPAAEPEFPVGLDPARCRTLLRATADHLQATGLAGRFSASGFWYENSFPVRALIAAGECFDSGEDTRAALRLLDGFVDGQGPDGNWDAEYFGRPGCGSPDAGHRTSNLADVGAMALCLALVVPADEGQATRYRESLERYLRQVVLPNQMASGAFPNRRYRGVDYEHPYSVATGVQASVLSAGFGLTGDPAFATAATRAAGYLADQVQADGAMVFHPFHADRPEVRESRDLGDLFYVIEGLLMAHRLPGDASRIRIETALERVFHGDRGLLRALETGAWWEPTDAWEGSKRAGLLYLWLLARREMGWPPRPELEGRLLTVISESPYREWLGVLMSPESPEGLHAYQATGFAGMSAAAAIDPDWLLARERRGP